MPVGGGIDPASYKFLWGPRAYEETSKLQVIDYVLLVCSNDVRSSLAL